MSLFWYLIKIIVFLIVSPAANLNPKIRKHLNKVNTLINCVAYLSCYKDSCINNSSDMTFLDNNLHSFVALNIFAVSFIFPDKLYCISIFKKIIKKKKKLWSNLML